MYVIFGLAILVLVVSLLLAGVYGLLSFDQHTASNHGSLALLFVLVAALAALVAAIANKLAS